MGKGSKQRPTDYKKFSSNYDQIFGKKDAPSAVDDCAKVTQESFAKKPKRK